MQEVRAAAAPAPRCGPRADRRVWQTPRRTGRDRWGAPAAPARSARRPRSSASRLAVAPSECAITPASGPSRRPTVKHGVPELEHVGALAVRVAVRRLIEADHVVAGRHQRRDERRHLGGVAAPAVRQQHRRAVAEVPGRQTAGGAGQGEAVAVRCLRSAVAVRAAGWRSGTAPSARSLGAPPPTSSAGQPAVTAGRAGPSWTFQIERSCYFSGIARSSSVVSPPPGRIEPVGRRRPACGSRPGGRAAGGGSGCGPAAGRTARTRTGRSPGRRESGRPRCASRAVLASDVSSWRCMPTRKSRGRPSLSSSSVEAARNRHPPGDDASCSHCSQLSNRARTRGSPRGARNAGRITWASNRAGRRPQHLDLQLFLGTEVGEQPALRQSQLGRQPADAQPLQAVPAGQPERPFEDALAGLFSLGHPDKIVRPFVSVQAGRTGWLCRSLPALVRLRGLLPSRLRRVVHVRATLITWNPENRNREPSGEPLELAGESLDVALASCTLTRPLA